MAFRHQPRSLNVLFLTHRLPYAPNRGDRVRAYYLLRLLHQYARVTVVSLVHDEDEARQAGTLAAVASAVHVVQVPRLRNLARTALGLLSHRPSTHAMLDAPTLAEVIATAAKAARPDVVVAYCSGMARLGFLPILRDVPMILDMVDVDSAKWADLAHVTGWPLSWIYRREARTLRAFEAVAAEHAVASMVVTERERDTLRDIAPASRIEVVPNGIDVESLRPRTPPPASSDVVFCGVMNYPPNEQAAVLLAREVWPAVRRRHPSATLSLVGSHPTRRVLDLRDDRQGIAVTGAVPDVRPFLWRAAVAAAPLRTARGIQNKVLEAVAAGLPTVVTPNIFASLPATIRQACRTGESSAELAHAIIALLDLSAEDRRAIATRADVATLTWDRQLSLVPSLLDEAAGRGVH